MRPITCAMLLALSLPALAQWKVDSTVPDWCHRGNLHWAIHYGRVTRSDVDLMHAARQNLDHGAGYESPETRAYAASLGIKDLVYICSRTFVVKNYEQHPELKQAVVRAFDGSEVLAYGNPVRRFGCVNCPEWRAYIEAQTRQVQATRNPAGIFYDNEAWFVQCYCPVCKAKFRDYTRQRYGKEMELPEKVDNSTPVGRAATMFLLDSATAYHKSLADFCHQCTPRLLCVPNTCGMNAWPLHSIEEGVTDLPFYERSSHAPFEDSLYIYKVALAAGEGRNVGNLMYLPDAIAGGRGQRVWEEGMHSFFNPSSPLAKEIALAIAEGAACDATYVANYNLYPSLPITNTKDPFCANVQQIMNRHYDFLEATRALYENAEPGADLAILHSVPTSLWRHNERQWQELSRRLNRAGLPYEVLVERNLKPEVLRRYQAIIVSGVAAFDDAGATALRDYVKGGGKVLFAGECGTIDDRGEAKSNATIRDLRGGDRHFSYDVLTGLQLTGFAGEADQGRLWLPPGTKTGRAALRFAGPAGRYNVSVVMTDENDGASPVSLLVNAKPVGSWVLDADDEKPRTLSAQAALRPGDEVAVAATQNGGEMCRLQSLTISDVRTGETVSIGKGRVLSLDQDLSEMTGPQLRDLVTRLTGTPRLSVQNPTGKLSCSVLSQPGRKLREVHLLNYDFTYDAPGNRVADDDGSGEARSYLSALNWRMKKILTVPDPAKFEKPALNILGSLASRNQLISLVVSVNGKDVATVAARDISGQLAIPLAQADLRAGDNEIILRVEGQPNTQSEWYQVSIDTDATTRRSFFSQDAGNTWRQDDLSEDRGNQTGEFLIRLVDSVKTPTHAEWEQMCHVHPAAGVRVFVAADKAPAALALSPTSPARPITAKRVAGGFEYVLDVETYAVLVLADDRSALTQWLPK